MLVGAGLEGRQAEALMGARSVRRFGHELEVTPLCGTLQALIARSMETKDPLE